MFDNLSARLREGLRFVRGGKLSTANIQKASHEIRRALLEADVALSVVQDFLQAVEQKAAGMRIEAGLSSYQAFVKLVAGELRKIIGGDSAPLNLKTQPPAVVMVAGLQGSGKTTTIAKLARHLKERENKKVLVASADVYRPGAAAQLQTLAEAVDVAFYPSAEKDAPVEIAKNAEHYASERFFDVLLLDTAGRLHIDDAMMAEMVALKDAARPSEILFVVDAMSGQDAAFVAKKFADALPLGGVILTKTDGDARGGAALSVRHITGVPIKFLGVGEKTDALEIFHPDRIASRILGMGDVLSLVEDISQKVDKKHAQKSLAKIRSGKFNLADLRAQLLEIQKMGGAEALLEKLPNFATMPAAVKNKIASGRETKEMVAVIDSMTMKERTHTALIKGSRKIRIAKGSGTSVQAVNRVLRHFEKTQKQMRKMRGGNFQKMLAKMQKTPGMADFSDISKIGKM